jgi:hypothetical protein
MGSRDALLDNVALLRLVTTRHCYTPATSRLIEVVVVDGIVFGSIGVGRIHAAFRLRSFRWVEQDSITGRLVNNPDAKVGDIVMAISGVLHVVGGILAFASVFVAGACSQADLTSGFVTPRCQRATRIAALTAARSLVSFTGRACLPLN